MRPGEQGNELILPIHAATHSYTSFAGKASFDWQWWRYNLAQARVVVESSPFVHFDIPLLDDMYI
jgi:hypothetical protein